MTFNLIDEQWIPIRRQSGLRERIAPWEVTHRYADDPVVSLDFPRPDFNGAIIQFLIGLIQTVAPPKTEDEWHHRLTTPPKPKEVRKWLLPIRDAFHLDGDGPRFLQDLDPLKGTEVQSLVALLIEQPGKQTEKDNLDHFIKRSVAYRLCESCSAAALASMQTNAPSGGKGYRTSMRGGGPLTTLLKGASLWETTALNVTPVSEDTAASLDPRVFPWLDSTVTSEPPRSTITTPIDASHLQAYWGMPRRYRLIEEGEELSEAPCSLCGEPARWSGLKATNYGVNYEQWRHPLSPYRHDEKKGALPLHPSRSRLTYRDWLSATIGESGAGLEPALPLTRVSLPGWDQTLVVRIWSFGYDMDNMKAKGWAESLMPIIFVPPQHCEDFVKTVSSLVQGADRANRLLYQSVQKALYGRPEKIVRKGNSVRVPKWHIDEGGKKNDRSIYEGLAALFWADTERQFFAITQQAANALELDDFDTLDTLSIEWRKIIIKKAFALFDATALSGAGEAADLRAISLARNELGATLYGKKMREILNIPTDPTPYTTMEAS